MHYWRQIAFSVCLTLVCLAACYSQARSDSTEATIREIRKEYARINSDSLNWRTVYKDIMGASTEGGDMTNYYNGKDVEKTVTNFLGEMGRARTEYYFENGKLIFEFEIHKFYDRPMTGNVVRAEENRYYFHNQRLIRWIGPKGQIEGMKQYPDKEKERLEDLKNIDKWTKSKKTSIEEE
jgi:hypothetical protein